MSKPKILIIVGSIREHRMGEVVASWFHQVAKTRDDAEYELVDLRALALPHLDHPDHLHTPHYNTLHTRWSELVATADGFVMVTPEYNHGYPAALKNAIDHLDHEWRRKAVTFVSYGGVSGGCRAVEQLRLIAVALRMASTCLSITIPEIEAAFDQSGRIQDTAFHARAHVVLDELLWWTKALKTARERSFPA